jgi:hypothetical protein
MNTSFMLAKRFIATVRLWGVHDPSAAARAAGFLEEGEMKQPL